MAAQQWWVQTDGPIMGPMSSIQLRELADQHRITPETLVSNDNATWMTARRLRGLFALGPQTNPTTAPLDPG